MTQMSDKSLKKLKIYGQYEAGKASGPESMNICTLFYNFEDVNVQLQFNQ